VIDLFFVAVLNAKKRHVNYFIIIQLILMKTNINKHTIREGGNKGEIISTLSKE